MPDPVDLIFNCDAAGNIPNIQSGALIAALVGQGLLAKMGKAGEEQRAWIDELAVDILIKHHNEDEAGDGDNEAGDENTDDDKLMTIMMMMTK